MELKIIRSKVEWLDDERHELLLNGKRMVYIRSLSECPEDAIIGRDLIDGNDISSWMMKAWEAGKNGEEFTIVWEEE